jgi:hypothetical protein
MAERSDRFTIARIEDQGDRILLYSADESQPIAHRAGEYHIIAPTGQNFRVGEEIEYQPCGANFGWFVRRVS